MIPSRAWASEDTEMAKRIPPSRRRGLPLITCGRFTKPPGWPGPVLGQVHLAPRSISAQRPAAELQSSADSTSSASTSTTGEAGSELCQDWLLLPASGTTMAITM